jgi:hypothetical protein
MNSEIKYAEMQRGEQAESLYSHCVSTLWTFSKERLKYVHVFTDIKINFYYEDWRKSAPTKAVAVTSPRCVRVSTALSTGLQKIKLWADFVFVTPAYTDIFTEKCMRSMNNLEQYFLYKTNQSLLQIPAFYSLLVYLLAFSMKGRSVINELHMMGKKCSWPNCRYSPGNVSLGWWNCWNRSGYSRCLGRDLKPGFLELRTVSRVVRAQVFQWSQINGYLWGETFISRRRIWLQKVFVVDIQKDTLP